MQYDPAAHGLAHRLTSEHVLSARPDAPVVPHRERPQPLARTRGVLAGGLHRVAGWVEPAPRTARA
jgi:hypothetical protein